MNAALRFGPLTAVGLGLVALGLGRAAGTQPRLIVLAAIGLALTAFAFMHLTGGLVLFTLATFFELLPTAFGGNLTLVKILGAVLTLAWIGRVVDRESNIRVILWEKPVLSAAAVTFALWGLISGIWAPDLGETFYYASRLAQDVVLLFVVYSAVRSIEHLRWVIWAFLAGAFLTTSYGLVNGLTAGDSGRLVGGIVDPNFLAAVIVAALVLSLAMFPSAQGFQRLLLIVIVCVLLPSLFLTGSRGGIVTLAATIIVGIVLAGPARAQVFALTIVLAAATVAYFGILAPASARDRVSAVSAADSAGRIDQYNIATRVFKDNPLAGVGLGNFTVVESNYVASTTTFYDLHGLVASQPVHNMYLSVLAELGVVGVALLAALFGGCLLSGILGFRERARAGDTEGEALGRGIVIATVAFLVAYALLPGLYDKQLWLMLGLCAALSGLRGSTRSITASSA